jgi:catechol 2,3-dioxygenase-like lactoylglutathione lyase family enzyme
MLRGIHHLALVTDDMRMTLDFYVRVLGMPIVHGTSSAWYAAT